ncbi:phosphoribosyl-AMP cyclohydrolase [Leptolyngbya sp. 7M]|nr:phosphoribosyl-AMP cyclohydrolase [Leptolyngbya sp. 7M]
MYYDCDVDTLLLKIEQVGDAACHTGARSCFFKTVQRL